MQLDKMETIKLKGKIVTLRTAKMKDGREFVELENCLKAFFNVDEQKLKSMIDSIPKSYIRNVQINDEKIRFIDRMALGIFLHENRNYDFFQWFVCRHVAMLDNYAIELFRKSTLHLLEKSNQVNSLKEKIRRYDDIQQDLLHNSENHPQSDEEKIEFANQVIAMRHERRALKNQLAFNQVAKEFFDKNKITPKDVNDVVKEMARLEEIFDKKIYVERANTIEHEEVKKEIVKKVESQKVKDVVKGLTQKQKQANITKMLKQARIR